MHLRQIKKKKILLLIHIFIPVFLQLNGSRDSNSRSWSERIGQDWARLLYKDDVMGPCESKSSCLNAFVWFLKPSDYFYLRVMIKVFFILEQTRLLKVHSLLQTAPLQQCSVLRFFPLRNPIPITCPPLYYYVHTHILHTSTQLRACACVYSFYFTFLQT